MIIHFGECENAGDGLLNDFSKYPYIDAFLEAILAEKTETYFLYVGVTLNGVHYCLKNSDIVDESACKECFKELKKIPKYRRRIIQDRGYLQWDAFERELSIDLDRR